MPRTVRGALKHKGVGSETSCPFNDAIAVAAV